MVEPAFEIVRDDEDQPAPRKSKVDPAAISAISMALKALSQRAVIALADLFTLITVLSVFWLWWSIPDPNTQQITALSIYAVFILAANMIVRKAK